MSTNGFDQNEIDSISQEIESISIDELLNNGVSPEVKPSLDQLKIAAVEYLNITNSLSNQLLEFTILLKRQKKIRSQVGKNNVNEVDEYIKNKEIISSFLNSEIPKKLYNESFKFQKILNNFLGQTVEMVFVMDGANGPELYRLTSEDMLKFDYSSSNQLSARYNTTVQNLENCCQKIQIDNNKLNFSLSGLNTTYSEVLFRYKTAKQYGNKMIFWNPNGTWKKMNVSAEGDINEAYASFVFLNKTDPSFMKELEYNVEDFLLKGVADVDNISGLLKGDVTVGNIEFGIKSAGASALGLKQMQTIAQQIASENFDNESLQKIKDEMIRKGRIRNKVREGVVKNAEDIISIITAHLKN